MVIKVDFVVTGEEKMHCSGCETRVRFALQRLPGVQEVLANAKSQSIAVVLNPQQVTIQEVQQRLKTAGFQTAVVGQ